jgi:hypothetical protein
MLGCSESSNVSDSTSITGLWKLYSMEVKDANNGEWKNYRNGMQGYLLYDGNKNMTIHLTDQGYENTNLKFPNFSDTIPLEALKYLTKSYYYIGEYKVLNDSMVQHKRISHSNPNDWGKQVIRQFKFSGDTLVITPTEEKNANLKLKWIKSSDE